MRLLFVALFVLAAKSCGEPASVKHAKMMNPGCDVVVVDENSFQTTVVVRCPDRDSFIKKYRKR